MNREKIAAAVLDEYRKHGSRNQEHILVDGLKHMTDYSLLCFAQQIGIDTDKILSQEVAS